MAENSNGEVNKTAFRNGACECERSLRQSHTPLDPGGAMNETSNRSRPELSLIASSPMAGHTALSRGEGHRWDGPLNTRQHYLGLLRADALEMHYQPIVALNSGKLVKVEALARLHDGDRLLRPVEFFPALGSEDFVELYGRGLEQALRQRNRWLGEQLDVQVSINLPSSALGDARYFDATHRILREYRCAPERLTLEILETGEIPRGVDAASEMAKFRNLGVSLAEDDLGSGHSSLHRLRDLPFDIVKIDGALVATKGGNPSDVLRFIYQLTRLGHSLGKSVIVEGVEERDLLQAIRILGADAVQGYVIARPMLGGQIVDWVRNQGDSGATMAYPDSTLAKLARLLMWEERLHLMREEIRSDTEWMVDPGKLIREVRAGIPFPTVRPSLQMAVAEAALTHGLRSTEYRDAREPLVAALAGRAVEEVVSK